MIRRLFTIMFAMLLWTVQTADAAIDHSQAFGDSGAVAVVQVAEDGKSGAGEAGICNAGCVCQVLHHACLREFESSAISLSMSGEVYVLARCDAAVFLSKPPTRPPLI